MPRNATNGFFHKKISVSRSLIKFRFLPNGDNDLSKHRLRSRYGSCRSRRACDGLSPSNNLPSFSLSKFCHTIKFLNHNTSISLQASSSSSYKAEYITANTHHPQRSIMASSNTSKSTIPFTEGETALVLAIMKHLTGDIQVHSPLEMHLIPCTDITFSSTPTQSPPSSATRMGKL